MIGTPTVEAAVPRRLAASSGPWPLALAALAGFGAALAAQSLVADWTGALACLMGFVAGSAAAGELLRQDRIRRPALAFGIAQFAMGAACCALPSFVPLAAVFCGASLAMLGRNSYTRLLGGAVAGSLAAPLAILPLLGMHGAAWICLVLGAAICALAVLGGAGPLTRAEPPGSGGRTRESSADEGVRPAEPIERSLLEGSFAAGALLFALAVLWQHLGRVAIAAGDPMFFWTCPAILLGLLLGASALRTLRWSLLFPCAALLLTAQLLLWDRAPAMVRLTSSPFAVIVLLLTPVSAILGAIFPRMLDRAPGPAGHLLAAHALGCAAGWLLAMFVLAPLAGSEVSLKLLAMVLAGLWVVVLLREPVTGPRLAITAAVIMVLLAVLFGKWWNWGLLTAGSWSAQGPAQAARADVHYLPPAFLFKQEDIHGGFTTVVEQTVVTGEVGHTIRTLFNDGRFRGDDTLPADQPILAAQFAPGRASALLIGLGTGQGAASLKRAGFGEIAVAEPAAGIVKAARACFGAVNEGVLDDRRLQIFLDDGRSVLLSSQRQFDLIAIEPGATELDSREFYQLVRSRLQPGGALQQSIAVDQTSPEEIAARLATVRSVFSDIGLWESARLILVAADHPLADPTSTSLLDSGGVARLLAARHPRIVTDADRYASFTPRRESGSLDFLRRYR